MSAKIEFQQISKAFYGVNALVDVSFDIEAGHIVGLIGENGAGKSTLMNLLGGNLSPDSGRMRVNGADYNPSSPSEASAAGVAFIHQELNLFTNLSIADNLFIDCYPRQRVVPFIRKKEIAHQAKSVLRALNLDISPTDLLEKLQPGEQQMIEIAKALCAGADIIIFDEPTTSLTSRETEHLFKIIGDLKKERKTIIYISHILKDVQQLCDDIVVLRDGCVIDTGAVEEFDVQRMIACMCGRQFEQLFPTRLSEPSNEVLLKLDHVSQPGVVQDVNLVVRKGQVLGLFGLMGSGRSEIARIIFGVDEMSHGRLHIGNDSFARPSVKSSIVNKLAFVSENRRDEGLMMNASIADNLALVSLDALSGRFGIINKRKLALLHNSSAALNIKADSLHALVKNLSGGNQQKVVIGKWLMSHPKLFIMDEPTRGIDVGAKYEVYSIINDLAARGTGILFISSELEELMGMCDTIVVLRHGAVTGEFFKENFDQKAIVRAAFGETAMKNEK